ncbi:alpha-galactosidase [Verrucomicrobiota bacterium]
MPRNTNPQRKGRSVSSESIEAATDEFFSDVIIEEKQEWTISYRSGWAVYEESLVNGMFVGRGWNGAGFVNFYDGRIDPRAYALPQAFRLEVDGQALHSDWRLEHFEKSEIKTGLHTIITLTHAVRPVTIRVHTLLDGTPVLTRWMEVTNTGSGSAALSAIGVWSGVAQNTKRWCAHLGDGGTALYSLGYFDSCDWGNEGDFRWHDLPFASYRIDGRHRRNRYRHPMFVLRNNATGEHFVGQLAWSGGYAFEFDLDTRNDSATLAFRAGPDAPAPLRVLDAGETVRSPRMHLGMAFGDLDTAIQTMHDHVRRSVMQPQPRGRGGWIESGIGPEIEITPDQVFHAIDAAAEIGAEVFFIDASWYAPPKTDWWKTVGDWEVNRQRFPEGITPFRDRVRKHGMLWGLWMDAERIGTESRIFKEHPDWIANGYDGKQRVDGLLDLGNPTVALWMEEAIIRVIEDNQLDFFRLDYNVDHIPSRTLRDGFTENGWWRYYDHLYAIYDRIRLRFPDLILENCAGGGGRTDLGMVRQFSHTWVTDWQIAPRSFAITNGMTMALPPEYVDRLIGGQSGHTTADFDFQARLLLFVRPTFGFLHPLGSRANPLMTVRAKAWADLYKSFVRPFMATGRMYHHTPETPGPDPHGWGVLELASRDRDRGICGLFQLAAPSCTEYHLRLRGLDQSRRYRVTFGNSDECAVVDGFVLMQQGLTVRLEGALTSELLRFEALT